jgi:lantibiotic modifying enzyme
LSDFDHVCCGESGRIELLLVAGQQFGRPDLIEEARRRTACMIARAAGASEGGSGYRSHIGCVERPFVPGFFQGLSGIGYQILRAAAPEALPSVLRWE